MKKQWMLGLILMLMPALAACGGGSSSSSIATMSSSSSAALSTAATSVSSTAKSVSSETPTTSSTENVTSSVSKGDVSSSEQIDDTYTIEAEYTDLTDKEGAGYSGGAQGREMVCQDLDGSAEASNGFYISYLYKNKLGLNFVFSSDRAVADVTLCLRLSCEIKDVVLTPENWSVRVNDLEGNKGGALAYGTIGLYGAIVDTASEEKRPFDDHVIPVKINLKKGENRIDLITTNTEGMGGTMYATAPMVDCIKLSHLSGAGLVYTPITSNLDLFE